MLVAYEEYLFWMVLIAFFLNDTFCRINVGEDVVAFNSKGKLFYPYLYRYELGRNKRLVLINPFNFNNYIVTRSVCGEITPSQVRQARDEIKPISLVIKAHAVAGQIYAVFILLSMLASFEFGFYSGLQILLTSHVVFSFVATILIITIPSCYMTLGLKIIHIVNFILVPAHIVTAKIRLTSHLKVAIPSFSLAAMKIKNEKDPEVKKYRLIQNINDVIFSNPEGYKDSACLNNLIRKISHEQ